MGRVASVRATSRGASDGARRIPAAGSFGPVTEPGEGGGSAGSETGGVHVTAGAESPAGGPAGSTATNTTLNTATARSTAAEGRIGTTAPESSGAVVFL